MSHDNFQPPEDPAHDEWVREQQAEAHWEKQLNDAYAEGRKDECEEWAAVMEMLKGMLYHFDDPRMEETYPAAFAKVKAYRAAISKTGSA